KPTTAAWWVENTTFWWIKSTTYIDQFFGTAWRIAIMTVSKQYRLSMNSRKETVEYNTLFERFSVQIYKFQKGEQRF
ncbi:MAG: hypothetical protein MPL62_11230, partial [Alphaproteobacteria bacterium]|nr:hypothetical protein [Alphaproteobacteria bacterium]